MDDDADGRSRLLGNVPIFGGIDLDTVRFLVARSTRVEVAAGDWFFRQGSRGTSAFVLESGRVSILKRWQDTDHLLRHLEAGDCFGEVALVDFGGRSASVRAETACRAIEFTARDLLAVKSRSPEQFAIIYMNIARELSRRLRAADERLFRAKILAPPLPSSHAFEAG